MVKIGFRRSWTELWKSAPVIFRGSFSDFTENAVISRKNFQLRNVIKQLLAILGPIIAWESFERQEHNGIKNFWNSPTWDVGDSGRISKDANF